MPRHDIPDPASKAELAEIARQLRASLPPAGDRRAPRAPDPLPPVTRISAQTMLRFVAAFVLPGLLLVVLSLVVDVVR